MLQSQPHKMLWILCFPALFLDISDTSEYTTSQQDALVFFWIHWLESDFPGLQKCQKTVKLLATIFKCLKRIKKNTSIFSLKWWAQPSWFHHNVVEIMHFSVVASCVTEKRHNFICSGSSGEINISFSSEITHHNTNTIVYFVLLERT